MVPRIIGAEIVRQHGHIAATLTHHTQRVDQIQHVVAAATVVLVVGT